MRLQGCSHPAGSSTCTADQWQLLITTLVAQLCFACMTEDAILIGENSGQLMASAALSAANTAIWVGFTVNF